MNTEKNSFEFVFKQGINLMIRGLIEQRNVDLEDVIYWLKDIVNDYEYDIKGEIEEEGYWEKNKEDLSQHK